MKQYSNAIQQTYSYLQKQTHMDPLLKEWIRLPKDDNCDSYLYETNIRPLVKFVHSRNIQPADWIQVDVDKDEVDKDKLYPDVDIVLHMIQCEQITPISMDKVSPFILASFDIECDVARGCVCG